MHPEQIPRPPLNQPPRNHTRPFFFARLATMTRIGWHLMTFNRLRMMATMLGVIFATILANQAIGTLLGLMDKFSMLERRNAADIWIVPKGTQVLSGGKSIPMATVIKARALPEVDLAMPMLLAGGSIKLPNGGAEPLQIIGTMAPHYLGGPWNIVQGSVEALGRGNTIILEDSERENLGSVNLGSLREINERLTSVVGFTYGLAGLGGGAYAFAEYEFTRELSNTPRDQTHYGLVKLKPGVDPSALQVKLASLLPEATVLTKAQLDAMMINNLLRVTPIGITFSAIAAFGVVIGFIIVSLSIFSAVSDNLREFGTLKAVGAQALDLALILFAQAVLYGVLGTVIGLGAVSGIAKLISSSKLFIVIQPWMILSSLALMVFMCCAASLISLLRLWKVEPGMVFR